jgi:hypothetical protein
VVLAYLIRGLSIARRTGEISAKGTVKASWIADTFNISHRAVKYAQAELRRLGWIGKDTSSFQRKLNRDGAYFSINLEWYPASDESPKQKGRASLSPTGNVEKASNHDSPIVTPGNSVQEFAPPCPKICTDFAPPREDKETSYEMKYQETQAPEPAGVCLEMEKAKSAKSRGDHAAPSWKNVGMQDLLRLDRLETLFAEATEKGWLNASEASALNFVAAAVRAREVGDDPPRLFVFLVRRGFWKSITQAQEDRARKALARCRELHPNCFRSFDQHKPRSETENFLEAA